MSMMSSKFSKKTEIWPGPKCGGMANAQTGYYNISIKTKSKQDRVIDRFIFSYCLSSPECLNNTILHFVNSVVSKSDINKKKNG